MGTVKKANGEVSNPKTLLVRGGGYGYSQEPYLLIPFENKDGFIPGGV